MKSRLLFGLSVASLVLSLAPEPGVAAVNPHYKELLRKGIASRQAGQAIQAAETLRLACFGMLAEPTELSSCLAHLGLAQSASGDRAGLQETWERIAEVERKFSAYASADLAASDRAAFAAALTASISPSELSRWPVFAPVPVTQAVDDLATLRPKKRRKELERRTAAEPQEPRWPFLLAVMDVDSGKIDAAQNRLSTLLALHPTHSESRCLAGDLALGVAGDAGADEIALDHYASCTEIASNPERAQAYLLALGRMERWEDATELYRTLDGSVQSVVQTTEFGQQIAELAEAAAASELASEAELEEPVLDVAAEIERVRGLAEAAQSLDDLDSALSEAEALAQEATEDAEVQLLAAEIAYRASAWEESVLYFERSGEIPRSRPLLLFYKSVSLYETGRRSEAEETLRKCLPRLRRTPYVQNYIEQILPDVIPQ